MIKLTKATLDDSKFVFNLRNKDYIRKFLYNTDKLKWKNHKVWFSKNYQYYYIIGDYWGVLRINKEDTAGDIYIALRKEYQGKGIGTELIKQISKNDKITIQVKLDNIPSQKMFSNAGFKKIGYVMQKIKG